MRLAGRRRRCSCRYVWARFFPDVQLRIMGMVPVMSFYLPFAMLLVDILFNISPIPGAAGIMVIASAAAAPASAPGGGRRGAS